MRRDGFYHSAFVLQKPNRTLLSVFRTFANRLCEVIFERSLCVSWLTGLNFQLQDFGDVLGFAFQKAE